MRLLNAAQMREADRQTIEDVGIASIVLMENAGRQVVGAIESTFDDLDRMRVAVLAGPERQIYRPLPRRTVDRQLRLGLRRQRTARQKVPGAPYRFGQGPR